MQERCNTRCLKSVQNQFFCRIIPIPGGGADLFFLYFVLGFNFVFSLSLGAGIWDGCSHMPRVIISRRGKEAEAQHD